MKSNLDLMPVVQYGSARVSARVVSCAVPFIVAAAALGKGTLAVGLFRGTVLGALDMVVMFRGMKKALPFLGEPERGVKITRRYRYYRLFVVASVIELM